MSLAEFKVHNITVGGRGHFFLMAGPCVLEENEVGLQIAEQLQKMAAELEIPLIFKASYTKANRSASHTYRGPGLEKGLAQLAKIRRCLDLPVMADVHCCQEIPAAAAVLDVLQIPAFLCRQTALIETAARTGKAINLKKGQFMAPWDMQNAVHKVTAQGNQQVFVTERGTCFGYNNLVVDMRSFVHMASFGYPVVFDGTHSTQLPAQQGDASGGQREMTPALVRAAVAAGCHGLFLEVHPSPPDSPSDSATILPLADLPDLLRQVLALRQALATDEQPA